MSSWIFALSLIEDLDGEALGMLFTAMKLTREVHVVLHILVCFNPELTAVEEYDLKISATDDLLQVAILVSREISAKRNYPNHRHNNGSQNLQLLMQE